ncbi:Rho/RAC guanine nucleotide exchange factor, putative [Entamoeba dispar SAW760]|uniref:Rho/RAC guanine nucleotide exchange factor, putative n=1 Tax=Entamoeba dispar (strain ATCC PRA-260 / SAW760) TaxID=370354 RepID=B0ET90_ENTDS|nr:Rho/RAC guanine nucleotide exchange factor, putative [Entamoeba dispar SAW760]EDR22250.1 Rho/RAC guanine nucleotide exchange factor, putative [Entamoeba dispar SAW760]|eukprot:EDR22250.1 Rho/RAC guanine nucleotide exchange factor, putative [Entamoeba dispar SAW760]
MKGLTLKERQDKLVKSTFERKGVILEVNGRWRFELHRGVIYEGMIGMYLGKNDSEKKIPITLDSLLIKPFHVYMEYLLGRSVCLKKEGLMRAVFVSCSLIKFGVSIENALEYGIKHFAVNNSYEDEIKNKKVLASGIVQCITRETLNSMMLFNSKQDAEVFRSSVEVAPLEDVIYSFSEWLELPLRNSTRSKHLTSTIIGSSKVKDIDEVHSQSPRNVKPPPLDKSDSDKIVSQKSSKEVKTRPHESSPETTSPRTSVFEKSPEKSIEKSDLSKQAERLDRIEKIIKTSKEKVRNFSNSFVISDSAPSTPRVEHEARRTKNGIRETSLKSLSETPPLESYEDRIKDSEEDEQKKQKKALKLCRMSISNLENQKFSKSMRKTKKFDLNDEYQNKEYKLNEEQEKALIKIQSFSRSHLIRKKYNFNKIKIRKAAINELYETEVSLLTKMKLMEENFMHPLMALGVSSNIINKIFLTLPQCIQSSTIFVDELKKRIIPFHADTCIGDLLSLLITYITPYLSFTTDYNIALNTWKSQQKNLNFQKVVKLASTSDNLKIEPLDLLLVQPVQRIMRYPMLIKEVIKQTPHSHPDYPYLKKALKEYHFFCTLANERSKMRDALADLANVLNMDNLFVKNRYLIWSCSVINKKKTKLHVFNDMIILVQKQGRSDKWIIIDTLPIANDVDVSLSQKTITLKKYGRSIPLIVELEDIQQAKHVLSSISSIIRDECYNLQDDRAWLDFLDRSVLN